MVDGKCQCLLRFVENNYLEIICFTIENYNILSWLSVVMMNVLWNYCSLILKDYSGKPDFLIL